MYVRGSEFLRRGMGNRIRLEDKINNWFKEKKIYAGIFRLWKILRDFITGAQLKIGGKKRSPIAEQEALSVISIARRGTDEKPSYIFNLSRYKLIKFARSNLNFTWINQNWIRLLTPVTLVNSEPARLPPAKSPPFFRLFATQTFPAVDPR